VAAGLLGNRPDLREVIERLQHELFIAMTEMAATPGSTPKVRIEARHATELEPWIDRFAGERPPLTTFVLPGGSPAGAYLHVARTVSRRAERELVALHRAEPVRTELLVWANRLSDLLFAMALAENHRSGAAELAPNYQV
jgi:cob(I)alamin adenosyltransferase